MSKKTKSNTVRIIAGRWRSRRIPVLCRDGLRPTTDRVRETLFNWLMHHVRGASCLDLFAGTGVLGLECLSRGAAFVQFVERDPALVNSLEENLVALRADAPVTGVSAELHAGDAMQFLRRGTTRQFDIVFIDPPFKAKLLTDAVRLLQDGQWLAKDAFIYVEQSSQRTTQPVPDNWRLIKQQNAGASQYSLYQC